jgi:prepilin-type N-terminal cleavage/methylation domain-containing protein
MGTAMLLLRTLESLVGSHSHPSSAAARSRGFTLLEIQIAIIILAVAMVGMVGQGRAYRMLLDTVETEHRFEGVALAGSNRVVVTVTDAGSSAAAPPCQVSLEEIEDTGVTLETEVVVTRRIP